MPEYAELLTGYRRFRKDTYPRQRERFEETIANGQHPKLMVVSCSDSRVDPAQIFDVDPGEIFVVRNVAALVPPYETSPGLHGVSAAVEFAVQFLKVKQILVMGHGRCGGCQAALSQSLHDTEIGEGGFVANWVHALDDVRDKVAQEHGTEGRVAELEMEFGAIKLSIDNLRSFPFVAEKEASGALKLRGAHFSISEGVLYSLDSETGEFISEE
jgi:carbonic anhydrase